MDPGPSKAKLGRKVQKKTATAVFKSKTGKTVYRKKHYARTKKRRQAAMKKIAERLAEDDPSIVQELGSTFFDVPSPDQTTRSHVQRRQASEDAWSKRRGELQQLFLRTYSIVDETCCCNPSCGRSAQFRCLDCGPQVYYCAAHVATVHQGKLHVPEEWQDDMYRPVYVKQHCSWSVVGHHCTTSQDTPVVVIDHKGRQHKVPISFCECFSRVGTLVQMRLWPASCTRPSVAFTWDLMEWLNILFLEGHVALKTLCESLRWLSDPALQDMIKAPYNLLVTDSFAEFRFFSEQIKSLQSVGMNLSTRCPICPKEEGNLILSFDGMFGLKRWKKSGQSCNPPRHGERFFLEQQKVDDFISSYNDKDASSEKNCNSFVAGSKLNPKAVASKLDETGVFGAVCRHEMPRHFFSLHYGERLGNAVYLLKHILQDKPEKVKLHVLYDIACKLDAHLKRTKQLELLEQTQLAVPTFHLYGHIASCQLKFNPRNLEGFALTDGEQVERLWLFMRNFSTITREMTSSNRIDSLTDALLHYGRKTCLNLDKLLVQRYKRAVETQESARGDLHDTMISGTDSQSVATMEEIEKWSTEGIARGVVPPQSVTGTDLTNEEGYVIKLMSYYQLCSVLQSRHQAVTVSVHIQQLARQLDTLDEQLRQLENGSTRWPMDDARYLNTVRSIEDRKRLAQLNKIYNLVSERWFLLQLKKKYADGHKIAENLSKQIKKQTGSIKKGVEDYNDSGFESVSDSLPQQLTWTDVQDAQNAFWDCLHQREPRQDTGSLPAHIKNLLVSKYRKVKNSSAEVDLLQREMQSMFTFYCEHQNILEGALQSTVALPTGHRQLILCELKSVQCTLHRMHRLFSGIVSLPPTREPYSVPVMTWDDLVAHAAYEDPPCMEDDDSAALDDLVSVMDHGSSSDEEDIN